MKVTVSEYFGHSGLYPFIPSQMFERLSEAFVSGLEETVIDDDVFSQFKARFDDAKIRHSLRINDENL